MKQTPPTRLAFYRFLKTWCLFAFWPSLCRKIARWRLETKIVRFCSVIAFAGCLLGAVFLHRLEKRCKQTPPKAVFYSLNFSLIWRCMLGTIFLHRLMEFSQKIYLNIGINSYDFSVSVCLELSVWASNRHLQTYTFKQTPSKIHVSLFEGVCCSLLSCTRSGNIKQITLARPC